MAKTSNELLHDSLLRRQIALAKYERGLQSEVVTMLDKTEGDLRTALLQRLADLEGKDFNTSTLSRLKVLKNAIAKIRGSAFDDMNDTWDESMQQLAVDESDYLDSAFKHVSPVQLDTVLPDPTLLAGLVSVQPMQGRLMADWASRAQSSDVQRIMDAVQMGMTQGQPTDVIVRRILGSQAVDGTDGVVQMTRRDVSTLTHTAVNTIANSSRQEYYDANSDIISTERWVATLDDATCPDCGDLDGQEFDQGEGEQPPLHFNCRCVRVPVIDGKVIGSRPANAATEDELDGLNQEDRAARVRELVGQVPATVTYSDWLAGQSDDFQDSVLGPTRAALFRDGGLELSKFTNANGQMYNLDQLRSLNPGAFKKADV